MVPQPLPPNRPTRAVIRSLATLALLVLVAAGGCQRVPLVAPTGSSITLVATTNVLPVNGFTTVTAIVIEGAQSAGTGTGTGTTTVSGGTPVHNGTVVTFTTTMGRIEPSEVGTNNGQANVRLIGDGRSGTATITAFSGGTSSTLDVKIGAAGATHIALTANPQTLPSNGGTSLISARVEDQQGNGLLGVPVSFSTTKGNLSSTTVLTDDQGFAVTTLSTTAAATVTATTGGATSALSGTVSITLKDKAQVQISAPTSLMVGVPARFTLTPGTTGVISDVSIDFGDGTGSQSLGAIAGATSIDHLFADTGDLKVSVKVTDGEGQVNLVSTTVVVAKLTVVLTCTPTTPAVFAPVVCTASVPTNAIIDSYQWDFGDGSSDTTFANQDSHAYNGPGTKVITVTAVPLGGGPAATQKTPIEVK